MKKKKTLPCRQFLLEGSAEIDIISLVKRPAIEMGFLAFASEPEIEHTPIKFTVDEEQRIITGPALIPDKLIYRIDPTDGTEYNGYFSADTVKAISEQYLAKHKQSNVNIEHEDMVDDICLSESWLVLDTKNDKSNVLGFSVPPMTWMVSMKVNNEDVWNELVKTGEVSGFSIEGQLAVKMNAMLAAEALTDEQKWQKLQALLNGPETEETLNSIIELLESV